MNNYLTNEDAGEYITDKLLMNKSDTVIMGFDVGDHFIINTTNGPLKIRGKIQEDDVVYKTKEINETIGNSIIDKLTDGNSLEMIIGVSTGSKGFIITTNYKKGNSLRCKGEVEFNGIVYKTN